MKKIVNYPNVFVKYEELPEEVKSVLKDRGSEFEYLWKCSKKQTQVLCKDRKGIILSGLAFVSKGDKVDKRKGLLISGGRLEAVLKELEAQPVRMTSELPKLLCGEE